MRDLAATVVLLGVLQGAALAAVLARREKNRLANRILAALVAGVALMLLLGYAESRWGWHGYPHLLGLGSPWPFLFGPLLYLYIVSLTRPFARVEARWLVHTLPFFAYIIYMSQVFYLKTGGEKILLAQGARAGQAPASFHILVVLEIVQAMSYLAMSWIALRQYGRKMEGYFSDLTRIDLRWLSIMVIAHAGVWSIVLASSLLRMAGIELRMLQSFSQAIQLASVLVLFLTGYVSLWQPELTQKARQAEVAEPPSVDASPTSAPKYQRNRLADDEAKEVVRKLEDLMTSRHAYRDTALTLQLLADSLGATPHLLSQVLNVHVGKSFYVFVNSYRTDALKALLADRSQRERGVLDLALEAGFNSKSTLNSFFKRHTGLTPTEYRKQALVENDLAATAKSEDISGG